MKLEILDMSNRRLGVIKDAYDVYIEHELGSWDTLRFCIPRTSPNWNLIQNELRVKYDDKFFIIKGAGAKMDDNGAIHREIECPCLSSELTSKFNQVLDVTGVPEVVLDTILAGTDWSRGTVSVSGGKSRTLQTEWSSVTSNLRDTAEKFNAYLFFHSETRKVDLIEDPGQDNGVTIQLGKNLLDIEVQRDSTDLVTRLYCYGADDLTFNNENAGITIDTTLRNALKAKGYIDAQIDTKVCGKNQSFIQDFTYFKSLGYSDEDIYTDILANNEASIFIRVGYSSEPDYVEPQALLEDSKKKLDELKLPKYTYNLSIIDLSKLSGFSAESFTIADWIYVYHPDLDLDIKARISRITEYPEFAEKTKIEISNQKILLSDVLSNTVKLGETLGNSPGVSNLVKGIINTFSTIINSANGKLVWDDGTLEAIDIDNPNKRVRLTAGGLGVSSDAGQTYNNAITGEGILADRIIVTEDIKLYSGDKHTVLTGDGLEVYDDSPTPVKTIHIGSYATGKKGIWINAGSIEIVGSLPDSNIPDISASKIKAGTLAADYILDVGSHHNIRINGLLDKISIYDDAATPVERVTLGKIASGSYGIEIMDPDGRTLLSSVNKEIHIGDGGTFLIGSTENNYKLKFDGTDLWFGVGSIKWDNLDPLVQENLQGLPGPAGPAGADGPAGPAGSDANVPQWVTDWNGGVTEVSAGYICTPKLFVGVGGDLATGIKTEEYGLVSYKNNLMDGFTLRNDGVLEMYDVGVKKAEFSYDTNGTGYDNPNRVFLRSMTDVALKLESGGEMSIQAKTGKIHITSETRFYGKVDMRDQIIDMTGSTIQGVALGGVAKFK